MNFETSREIYFAQVAALHTRNKWAKRLRRLHKSADWLFRRVSEIAFFISLLLIVPIINDIIRADLPFLLLSAVVIMSLFVGISGVYGLFISKPSLVIFTILFHYPVKFFKFIADVATQTVNFRLGDCIFANAESHEALRRQIESNDFSKLKNTYTLFLRSLSLPEKITVNTRKWVDMEEVYSAAGVPVPDEKSDILRYMRGIEANASIMGGDHVDGKDHDFDLAQIVYDDLHHEFFVVSAGGRPHDGRLDLGENWKDSVGELMNNAALIIFWKGKSQGLQWEEEEIFERGFLEKTLFVETAFDFTENDEIDLLRDNLAKVYTLKCTGERNAITFVKAMEIEWRLIADPVQEVTGVYRERMSDIIRKFGLDKSYRFKKLSKPLVWKDCVLLDDSDSDWRSSSIKPYSQIPAELRARSKVAEDLNDV